ncbi:hypothetical protein B0H12DRAFT_1180663 [Mycena haematopus]|nr:hypothetical protein B0H12DRAFT_1180663 [Mycena haematopus]
MVLALPASYCSITVVCWRRARHRILSQYHLLGPPSSFSMSPLFLFPALSPIPSCLSPSFPASILIFSLQGHISRDCPQAQKRACYTCGSEGHISRDCPGVTEA